jgi:hypothetical protein
VAKLTSNAAQTTALSIIIMAQGRNSDVSEWGGGGYLKSYDAIGKRDNGLFSVILIESMSEEKKENSV